MIIIILALPLLIFDVLRDPITIISMSLSFLWLFNRNNFIFNWLFYAFLILYIVSQSNIFNIIKL